MDPYNCLMGRMPPKGGTTLPGNGRLAEASASLAMLCLGVGVGLAFRPYRPKIFGFWASQGAVTVPAQYGKHRRKIDISTLLICPLRASSFCHRAGVGRLAGQGALLDDLITIVLTSAPVDPMKSNGSESRANDDGLGVRWFLRLWVLGLERWFWSKVRWVAMRWTALAR